MRVSETQPEPGLPPCPNCGDPAQGNFCPTCGQRRGDRRVTLRRLIADAVEDQLSVNGTLPRTLGTLLFKPGRLTIDFIEGRVARYVPPFRLYLVASFIFFLVISFGGTGEATLVSTSGAPGDTTAMTAADTARVLAAIDSVTADDGDLGFLPAGLREHARLRLHRIVLMEQGQLNEILKREMIERSPLAIFLLLPIYAAILALLYIRSRRYYVEHFVFALHVHAFVFLLFALDPLLDSWAVLSRLLVLWVVVYGFLALRRVYRQSIPKTLLKYTLLAALYLPLLVATLFGMLFYVLMVAPV